MDPYNGGGGGGYAPPPAGGPGPVPPACSCGCTVFVKKTSNSERNPGRVFFSCRGCNNFIGWEDGGKSGPSANTRQPATSAVMQRIHEHGNVATRLDALAAGQQRILQALNSLAEDVYRLHAAADQNAKQRAAPTTPADHMGTF